MRTIVMTSALAALLIIGYGGAQSVTPSQQEGPFYPLEKLDDRDNDLTVVAGSGLTAAGDLLLLTGTVRDDDGQPVAAAVVEIWQTDVAGIYLHPNDPGTESRDRGFQFYGESVTAADGGYAFRTVLPGQYEPRPRHIHFKVRIADEVVLTSQLYFTGFEGGATARAPAELTVQLSPATDALYPVAYLGEKDIVLRLD
jgi:protocatechuate 3,4-dioxygenase beta subunit